MAGDNHHPSSFAGMLRQVAATGLGALHNRGELLAVEWQEEWDRRKDFLFAAFGCVFLGGLALVILTGIVIFLFPVEWRLYVAGAFVLLYAIGALWCAFRLKSLLEHVPFSESLNQLKKDREWLESLR
jgi:uncharacterized membrane protein YqjE